MRPKENGMLVEIRIGGESGAQTVFPGSVHETGEHIEWSENGEPAKVEDGELLTGVSMLASACLFARYWPGEGGRHEAALTIGGFLSRVGYQPAQIRYFVEAIARAAGDPEHRDRERAAEDAAKAYRQGGRAYGLRKLKEVFNEPVATQVAGWLNYSAANSETGGEDGSAKRAPSSNDIITEQSAALQFAEEYGDAASLLPIRQAVVSLERCHLGQGRARRVPTIGLASFRAAWAKIKPPRPARTWAGRRSRTVSRSSPNTIRRWS